MSRLRILLEVWRAEGRAGTGARIADHLSAARRRAGFRRAPLRHLPPVPILQLTGHPPAPWLGGVSAQLAARSCELERLGPAALLFPWRDGVRVEVTASGCRMAAELRLGRGGDPRDPLFAANVRAVADALDARLLHAEGAAGLSHEGLRTLAEERPLLLSLHDLALFCPRPDLFDRRAGGSCGGCVSEAACRARLSEGSHPEAEAAGGWRRRGAELLEASHCVVYSSRYLLAEHVRLFGHAGARAQVIAPGISQAPLRAGPLPVGHPRGKPRIAFLGGGHDHKGAALFGEVVTEWDRRGLPAVVWEVHGGGGLSRLRALRRLPGVRVRGYYRHGSLPDLLRRRRIDLCLLLPQVPESFSLTLSEVLAAGTPVLAISTGALSERLRSGGGHLLPPRAGPGEIVDAVRRCLSGALRVPPAGETPPSAREAAVAFGRLHSALLAAVEQPVFPSA